MVRYVLTSEELAEFARQIYEEACGGYLDLKNSICDKIVKEFVEKRREEVPAQAPQPTTENNRWESSYEHVPSRLAHEYAGPENNAATWTYTTNVTTGSTSGHEGIYFRTRSGNQMTLEDIAESRDETSVSPRIEEFVRPDGLNYEGNESERF